MRAWNGCVLKNIFFISCFVQQCTYFVCIQCIKGTCFVQQIQSLNSVVLFSEGMLEYLFCVVSYSELEYLFCLTYSELEYLFCFIFRAWTVVCLNGTKWYPTVVCLNDIHILKWYWMVPNSDTKIKLIQILKTLCLTRTLHNIRSYINNCINCNF
jgi:hypothetical protein